MVAASAAVATLTTLCMGALSDRLGRRKAFICAGVPALGPVHRCRLAFITVENAARWFPAANAAHAAALLVVVMDCVMTSSSVPRKRRGLQRLCDGRHPCRRTAARVESVLAVLPLLSMLVIFRRV